MTPVLFLIGYALVAVLFAWLTFYAARGTATRREAVVLGAWVIGAAWPLVLAGMVFVSLRRKAVRA